jgi:hypothetical protein
MAMDEKMKGLTSLLSYCGAIIRSSTPEEHTSPLTT